MPDTAEKAAEAAKAASGKAGESAKGAAETVATGTEESVAAQALEKAKKAQEAEANRIKINESDSSGTGGIKPENAGDLQTKRPNAVGSVDLGVTNDSTSKGSTIKTGGKLNITSGGKTRLSGAQTEVQGAKTIDAKGGLETDNPGEANAQRAQ